MNQSKISVRYAKAFYEYASEKGATEKVVADVKMLLKGFADVPELLEVFHNPIVKPSKKKLFVSSLLANKVCTETISFINLIISNNREMFIQDILRSVLDIYHKNTGITTVTITSAVPLSDAQEKSVVDYVTKKKNTKVELQTKTDASLMGGFVLRIDDLQYDASIKTRLKEIKNELIAKY